MIYNRYRPQYVPSSAILVDRTTKWGNPHRMRVATRAERQRVLLRYCVYLRDNPELVLAACRELRDRDLVCWCVPLDCHAEILQGLAKSKNPFAYLEQCIVKYMMHNYRR